MPAPVNQSIPVLVTGALGRMGAEVIRAVQASPDCHLVGAVDTTPGKEGADVGELLGLGEIDVAVTADLEGCLCACSQAVRDSGPGQGAVMVDFTHPSVVYANTRASIAYGVHPVIGTTGLGEDQKRAIEEASADIAIVFAPNMSVGVNLCFRLLQLAAEAGLHPGHAVRLQPLLLLQPRQPPLLVLLDHPLPLLLLPPVLLLLELSILLLKL